jgi:hypothetical protein
LKGRPVRWVLKECCEVWPRKHADAILPLIPLEIVVQRKWSISLLKKHVLIASCADVFDEVGSNHLDSYSEVVDLTTSSRRRRSARCVKALSLELQRLGSQWMKYLESEELRASLVDVAADSFRHIGLLTTLMRSRFRRNLGIASASATRP